MDEAAKADAANLSPHEAADIYKIHGLKIAKTGVSNRKTLCTF
jgi:hypothetical protein